MASFPSCDESASSDVDARLSKCFTALAVAGSPDVSEASPSFASAMVTDISTQTNAFSIARDVPSFYYRQLQ
jgi:hypothetical protein